jgi:2-keto-4-pentenoate hydratase
MMSATPAKTTTRQQSPRSAPGAAPATASEASAAAARWLRASYRARAPLSALPKELAPADLAGAYAIQDAFVALKARGCGAPVGWKIALSNPAMQAMVGLPAPIAGRLMRRQVVGGPARTRVSAYTRLAIEFEIAVELGADLPAPDGRCSREQAAAAVAAIRPAFELVDDQQAVYAALGSYALQMVADNAWNQGAVLGQRRADWRALELGALHGRVFCDDVAVGEGHGRDLMGHPLDALAWLAGYAGARGHTMRRGEVAILGSMVTSRFPKPGERWRFELEGFAPLELAVDA